VLVPAALSAPGGDVGVSTKIGHTALERHEAKIRRYPFASMSRKIRNISVLSGAPAASDIQYEHLRLRSILRRLKSQGELLFRAKASAAERWPVPFN
jgi:hypothetical protein